MRATGTQDPLFRYLSSHQLVMATYLRVEFGSRWKRYAVSAWRSFVLPASGSSAFMRNGLLSMRGEGRRQLRCQRYSPQPAFLEVYSNSLQLAFDRAAGSRSGRSRNRNTPVAKKMVSFGRVDSVSVVTHAAGLRSGILDSPKEFVRLLQCMQRYIKSVGERDEMSSHLPEGFVCIPVFLMSWVFQAERRTGDTVDSIDCSSPLGLLQLFFNTEPARSSRWCSTVAQAE